MLHKNSEELKETSEYIDSSNNIKQVRHSTIINEEERKEIEEQIVEELYRIFAHKAI